MAAHHQAKAIYLGAFVHSASLKELDICTTGAIGVDESGKIAFVDRNADLDAYSCQKAGWEQTDIVRIRDNGFFFPGFIGNVFPPSTSLLSPSRRDHAIQPHKSEEPQILIK